MDNVLDIPSISIIDKCEVLAAHYQGSHDEEKSDQGLTFLIDGLKELKRREEGRMAKGALILLQESLIPDREDTKNKAVELLTDLLKFTDASRDLHILAVDLLRGCQQDDKKIFYFALRAFEDFVAKHYK